MATYDVYYPKIVKGQKGYRIVCVEANTEAQARRKWEREFPYLVIHKIELGEGTEPVGEADTKGEEQKRGANISRTGKLWMGFGCLIACLAVVAYEWTMIEEGYELAGIGYALPIILGVVALVFFAWAKKKESEEAISPDKLEAKQEKRRAKIDRMKRIVGQK